MKKIIIILLFASGCSTTHVYNIKSSIDVTNDGLKEQSANNYKASQVDDTIPLPVDSVHFHEALIANPSYRKYLYVECLRLLERDNGLILNRPVYASIPTWNSWIKMFNSIFSFESLVDNVPVVKTMQCDLAIDNKKEVKEYQVKDFTLSLIKED